LQKNLLPNAEFLQADFLTLHVRSSRQCKFPGAKVRQDVIRISSLAVKDAVLNHGLRWVVNSIDMP
jgi:hypothetical protein